MRLATSLTRRVSARIRNILLPFTAESGYSRDDADPRKRVSPSAERNKAPILEVLLQHVPPQAPAHHQTSMRRLLEIGSGTGQHAAHLASSMPHVHWQPTETTGCAGPQLLEHQVLTDIFSSIVAHTEHLPNVALPLELDAAAAVWPDAIEAVAYDALLAVNVAHISPVLVTQGIITGAARRLTPRGKLLFYGPFLQRGHASSDGNQLFDEKLRCRGLGWGLREVEWITELATDAGLMPIDVVQMPSNNLMLVFGQS